MADGNEGKRKRGSGGRRWPVRLLKGAIIAILGFGALFVVLLGLYAVIHPPSTLMLGRWLTFRDVDRRWAGIDTISPRLVDAVVMSEDGQFCSHHGVDWGSLREVLQDSEDGPSRGASTITMQVVKNLFLWPSRSYVRKGLEIPLALIVDAAWSKRRIVEVYLNIAEWGDGVFGAEAASQAAFGKGAAALSAREAALLATTLPNPIRRHAGRPSRGHQRLAGIVLARMGDAENWTTCIRR
jgi:monofunctional glycosyltransferase